MAFTLFATTLAFARWTPPRYNSTVWMAFRAKVLTSPYPTPTSDPYANASFHPSASLNGTVCAVKYENETARLRYTLITFASEDAAATSGAHITHRGACGLCSTLHDLSIYMEHFNLTAPVRSCGLKHPLSAAKNLKCLLDLGFTNACAAIWFDNEKNTKKNCFVDCIVDLNKPYNGPPPARVLNSCLQCDEDKSGPVFKAVARRTRRSSGLSSAIYRPPSTIFECDHYYY